MGKNGDDDALSSSELDNDALSSGRFSSFKAVTRGWSRVVECLYWSVDKYNYVQKCDSLPGRQEMTILRQSNKKVEFSHQ